jgi:hypothetical protein
MSTGEPEVLSQKLHQQGALFDIARNGFAVHGHGHLRHSVLPGPYARVFDVFRKMESRFGSKPAGFASFEWKQSGPTLPGRSRHLTQQIA